MSSKINTKNKKNTNLFNRPTEPLTMYILFGLKANSLSKKIVKLAVSVFTQPGTKDFAIEV
jgi:hypothetical protein